MSDDRLSGDEAAAFLTTSDTVTDVVEFGDGTNIEIVAEAPTNGELQHYDEQLRAGEVTEGEVVDKFLVEPDVDVDAIPVDKLSQLLRGIQRAWMGSDLVDAMEQLDAPGNR